MSRPPSILTLDQLYAAIPAAGPAPLHQPIAALNLPEPAQRLLVHDQHMTVVMERQHRFPVTVEVQARHRSGDSYSRLIRLRRTSDGVIVQGGLVRINLATLPPEVAAAILAEQVPLGRLLIHHQVLRQIDVRQYLRFPPQPSLESWLGRLHGQETFGRLGYLHIDGQPVVELFEILASASLGAEAKG